MDNISTKFSGLAQNFERRLVRIGTTMVGGHREESEKTLLGREVVIKPNIAGGSVSPSKSGPEPPL